jgi:hypothetical protein
MNIIGAIQKTNLERNLDQEMDSNQPSKHHRSEVETVHWLMMMMIMMIVERQNKAGFQL